MKKRIPLMASCVFLAKLCALGTASALAQTSPATAAPPDTPAPAKTPAESEVVMLDAFEVTGSYLPAAADAIATPVITMDATAIEQSATRANILDSLRKTVPQFSGNGNLGTNNANIGGGATNGGSAVALRNAATLVLINGRRMAVSPVSGTGGANFVDVNLIPFAAIERIEVLPDGASAIYGTDAVSGVVNVLLRDHYDGFELGGRYGFTDNAGRAEERSAYVMGGVGNDKTRIAVAAENATQEPIFNFQRPYSAETFGTGSFPGSVSIGNDFYLLSPSINAPAVVPGGQPAATLVTSGVYTGPQGFGPQSENFNLSQFVTQSIKNERSSFVASGEHKFSDRLTFFADALFSKTATYSQINGQPLVIDSLAGDINNPFDEDVLVRNRFLENPRGYAVDTNATLLTAGFKGRFNEDWTWEAAFTHSMNRQDYANPGVINTTNLDAAIASGLLNLFAREQAPGAIAASGAVGTATSSFESKLTGGDFRTVGRLYDLPAGSLDLALGGEYREESLTGKADPLSIPDAFGNIGWNGGSSLSPFSARREINAGFAELRVPLLKEKTLAHYLEVSGAVRHENYSDTDDPTVPKITFRYLPFDDQFAIRGTYSESFAAPTLFDLFGPSGVGFTDDIILDPIGPGLPDPNTPTQTNRQDVGNPNLAPSTSQSYTIGFVFSPKAIRGLSFSADYFRIKQDGLVSRIEDTVVLQSVEDLGPASPYADRVRLNGFGAAGNPITAPGQISGTVADDIYLTTPLVNLASTDIQGVDIQTRYEFEADGIGQFDIRNVVGIYLLYETVRSPGDAPQDDAGRSSILNGTLPRWQSFTSVDYTRGPIGAYLGYRFIPGMKHNDGGDKLDSFYTLDGAISYTLKGKWFAAKEAKFTLGVDNITNQFGPLDPTSFGDSNVDTGTYGAMGRFYYVDVKFTF
jgi:iron complex outermembrane receptor protein